MKYSMLLILATVIFYYPSVAQVRTITKSQFLDQLKSRHPLFAREKLTVQIEKEEQNSYAGAQDWNLISSLTFSHEEPAIAFAGPEKTNLLAVSGGVEKVFWNTGSRLSASFTSSTARINPTFGFSMPFYQNEIALNYIHPLLKNSHGYLDR